MFNFLILRNGFLGVLHCYTSVAGESEANNKIRTVFECSHYVVSGFPRYNEGYIITN